jgi:hypothetical protein
MTFNERRMRKFARLEGDKAITAINAALTPVYEGDEELWERLAEGYARSAWKYAVASKRGDPEWEDWK